MIIFRDASREVETREELGALARLADSRDGLGFVVRLGEFEQAVLDATHPTADGWSALAAAFRRALVAAAGEFLEAGNHTARAEPLRRALAEVEAVAAQFPPRLRVRPPEGYAHYALDPGAYARAAAKYRVDVGAAHAARAVVIGVRSIGTSLSAVVAAAVGSSTAVTVRPRGPSGGRQVLADGALVTRLLTWLGAGGDVLVVDEGPGATGETFAAVASWLRGLGVDERRIVLFPSRGWGMPLAPPDRVAWFERARKYPPSPGDERPTRIAEGFGLGPLDDLCAGRWRSVVPGAATFPASPTHERLKYRATAPAGDSVVIRYAGLGRWGADVLERARRLADRGIGPEPIGSREGFLVLRWVAGTPLAPQAECDSTLVHALGDYLATRSTELRTGREVDPAPIIEALRVNATEALGAAAPGLRAALRRLERLPAREAVTPDARLQRREWLRTANRLVKVDAIDHGDGLRLPGPTDAAWDIAGAVVEFGLDREATEALVRRCAGARSAEIAVLTRAVDAYLPAYAAVHLADAVLAMREAAEPIERARWAHEARRYRAALAATLVRGRDIGAVMRRRAA